MARWILTPPGVASAARPPDLVLFQEIWTRAQEELLREALGAHYELVGTPQGWLLRKGGLLALVRRGGALRCLRSQFHEYAAEASPWRVWEGDGFADKGVQQLELRVGDEPLVAFHTHLQAGYPGAEHGETRAAQLAELAGWIARAPESAPALALGDLNAEPAAVEQLLLARNPRWRDLTAPLRTRRECWSPPDSAGREKWIDYVIGRAGKGAQLRVERSDCMPSRPADHPFSDHPGLDLDLAIEPVRRDAGWLDLDLAIEPVRRDARWLVPALTARLAAPQCRRAWLGSLALLALAAALPVRSLSPRPCARSSPSRRAA